MATKPKSDQRECRALVRPVEIRSAENEGATASGYAALFGVETNVGGYFRERIMPGAFKETLARRDIIAVHSHDTGRVVGRTGAGTLILREDATGLHFDNDLPDTTDGRDLRVQIKRGDIPGMSFAFIATRSEWDDLVDPPLRTIHEAELYEITYSALPQYPDTSVALRSLEHARNERQTPPIAGIEARNAARAARLAQAERGIR